VVKRITWEYTKKRGGKKTEKYTGLGRMMVLKLPKERKVANIAVVISS